MIKGIKIRLLPTKEQEIEMFKTLNVCRFVWNWGLNFIENHFISTGEYIIGRNVRNEFTKAKKSKELCWVNEVSSKAYNNEFSKLEIAYKRFFNKTSNKPKFKSKKRGNKSFYVRNDEIRIDFKTNLYHMERIGKIRFKPDKRMIGICKYSNIQCSYDGKHWILSFGIEVESQNFKLSEDVIGLDLGIKELITCSDKTIVHNINKSIKVKKLKKKLKRLNRQCSRKYEKNKVNLKFVKTKNIIKLEKSIKYLYRKISNIRKDNIHKATTNIVNSLPKAIVLENLNVTGMMKNRHLSKAIKGCNFYEIRRQIEYKSDFKGIQVIVADRFFPSSKTCNNCGAINKYLKLSDRIYKCECGYEEDRDLNASYNLRDYGISVLRK